MFEQKKYRNIRVFFLRTIRAAALVSIGFYPPLLVTCDAAIMVIRCD